jgi:exopolysaccharide biosynthesis WecB/TagA/CpsF family protein
MSVDCTSRSAEIPIAQLDSAAQVATGTHKAERVEFLGIAIDKLTLDAAVSLAAQAMQEGKRLQHGDVNVAKLVAFGRDTELRRCTAESDLICADGMGVVWGCRLMGVPVPERVAGCDLMMRLIALCAERGLRPYFLGATQAVLENAISAVRRQHPGIDIAGWQNGYFSATEESAVVAAIRESNANCLFVGMSSPRKELFLNKYRDQFGVPVQLGVGGSFDVLAGHVVRAPLWMQARGMEWLFRLGQEPARLWRRYLTSNAQYAAVLGLALARKVARSLRPDQRSG